MVGTPGRRFTADDWHRVIVPLLVRELGQQHAARVVDRAEDEAGEGATTGLRVKAIIKSRDYPAMKALERALKAL